MIEVHIKKAHTSVFAVIRARARCAFGLRCVLPLAGTTRGRTLPAAFVGRLRTPGQGTRCSHPREADWPAFGPHLLNLYVGSSTEKLLDLGSVIIFIP